MITSNTAHQAVEQDADIPTQAHKFTAVSKRLDWIEHSILLIPSPSHTYSIHTRTPHPTKDGQHILLLSMSPPDLHISLA